jgi:hypothetical protein
MDYTVFEVTGNQSFDYFFSLVLWVQIVSIPMILALNVITQRFFK